MKMIMVSKKKHSYFLIHNNFQLVLLYCCILCSILCTVLFTVPPPLPPTHTLYLNSWVRLTFLKLGDSHILNHSNRKLSSPQSLTAFVPVHQNCTATDCYKLIAILYFTIMKLCSLYLSYSQLHKASAFFLSNIYRDRIMKYGTF